MKKNYLYIVGIVALLSGCASTNSGSKVKPDYERAYQDYLSLGAQYLQMGRYDLAEPKLKRAIEIDSEPAEAWNVLAVLYEEKGDIAAGYQVYEKLTTSHPDYALGFINFATFLCKFNRDPERQALYQRMRGKDQAFATLSYIAEGNCAQERGNNAGAVSAYEQALSYDRYAAGALLPLAEIALNQGDANTAQQYLRVVHTYVGYSPESIMLGIQAAQMLGDEREIQNLQRMLRANSAISSGN
ncbi:tetratricopeptide repeat protein [Cardiobacteriaceae bacterium TAE3-ERU3]|nr:tetratricopeptide repeat protein [Cardiobacteriaceae bacterium TAE3-ERU3]